MRNAWSVLETPRSQFGWSAGFLWEIEIQIGLDKRLKLPPANQRQLFI